MLNSEVTDIRRITGGYGREAGMDDKGEIVSSYDVDENIALQIWTKGLSPRLVVFNRNQNTKKLIHLSWLEKTDRKLSVKGKTRGASTEYVLADLLPVLQRILAEYAVYTCFRPRLWKFVVILEKVLHTPAIISEKSELALMPEEKRAALWLADLTGGQKGEGFFRPFFPLYDEEERMLAEADLSITGNRKSGEDLAKTGVIRKLSEVRPPRWHHPVRAMATAMLLGFSYCEEDGSELSDELWRGESGETPFSLKIEDPRLKDLGRKFTGYVRHFEAIDRMEARILTDSDRELQKEKYTRKRRMAFPSGAIGDVAYSVTFFEREDGMMALGCKPRAATLRHRGELVYTLPAFLYEQALVADTVGGAPDDFFTVMQLTAAKRFSIWLGTFVPYVASFTGLI